MLLTSKHIISAVQTIHHKAKSGFSEADIEKVKGLLTSLISIQELDAAISVAKICPNAIDIRDLVTACSTHNPLLLDSLMTYPGVNPLKLQEAILDNLNPTIGMQRLKMWYPDETQAWPTPLQLIIARKVYIKIAAEIMDGPVHKRELSQESGELLIQALHSLHHGINNEKAAFSIEKATHYVLRGISRMVPLQHQLPDHFASDALNAVWSYQQQNNTKQTYVNTIALTLSNTDAFNHAKDNFALHYPVIYKIIEPYWNAESKEITKFITSLRKEAGMDTTIVSRNDSSLSM